MSLSTIPTELKLLILSYVASPPIDTEIELIETTTSRNFTDRKSATLRATEGLHKNLSRFAKVDKAFNALYKANERRLIEGILARYVDEWRIAVAIRLLLKEVEKEFTEVIVIDDEEEEIVRGKKENKENNERVVIVLDDDDEPTVSGAGSTNHTNTTSRLSELSKGPKTRSRARIQEYDSLGTPPFEPCISVARLTELLNSVMDGGYRAHLSNKDILSAPDFLRLLWTDTTFDESETFQDRSQFLYWMFLRFAAPRYMPSPELPNESLDRALRTLLGLSLDTEIGPDAAKFPDNIEDSELQDKLDDCEFPSAYIENARVLHHLPTSVVLPMMFESVDDEETYERAKKWLKRMYGIDFDEDWEYWAERFPTSHALRELYGGGYSRPVSI